MKWTDEQVFKNVVELWTVRTICQTVNLEAYIRTSCPHVHKIIDSPSTGSSPHQLLVLEIH